MEFYFIPRFVFRLHKEVGGWLRKVFIFGVEKWKRAATKIVKEKDYIPKFTISLDLQNIKYEEN